MTTQTNENQESKPVETKVNDKEYNFRQLEAKYERQLQQERAARLEAERIAKERLEKRNDVDEDEDDEPYVDKRKLNKTLAKFGQQQSQQTQNEIQKAVQTALHEERKQNWIKNNPDFYDILKNAEKLAMKDPDLAESILEMPDNFERQKLVYKNIKALGLHKPEEKPSSIQDKIEANRKAPFYQPSHMGNAPYSQSSDFSPKGQKQAYDKMQELKQRLGLR